LKDFSPDFSGSTPSLIVWITKSVMSIDMTQKTFEGRKTNQIRVPIETRARLESLIVGDESIGSVITRLLDLDESLIRKLREAKTEKLAADEQLFFGRRKK
jgi:hypothetical protein